MLQIRKLACAIFIPIIKTASLKTLFHDKVEETHLNVNVIDNIPQSALCRTANDSSCRVLQI